jgi:hypothetical protein
MWVATSLPPALMSYGDYTSLNVAVLGNVV